jgi:exonuclease SbcD
LIPVAGGRGLVAAVPFVRPIDVPADLDDPLASIYGEVIEAARARRQPGQSLIALGHLYVAGADSAMLSERRVSIGGQESASARMFPADLDYVALGHIHRAQRIGRDTMRYAGAPIPLALEEAAYKHSVAVIDLGELGTQIRLLPIPRAVPILRVPKRGAAPIEEVLAEIAMLEPRGADDRARPYLEVVVALERPEPRLRTTIEAAMDGKAARLVALHVEHTGDRAALGDGVAQRRLAELDPRDVFVRLWARDHVEPPAEAIVAAFERLLAEVRGDVGDLEAS